MFAPVKTEVSDRLFALDVYFQFACRAGFHVLKTAKGLAFVQMYAAYEFCVTASVRAAIGEIKSRGMAKNTVRWELLSLILAAEVRSLRMCGQERLWYQAAELMVQAGSGSPISTADGEFPDNGSQYRRDQLELIWHIFGISSPIVPHGRIYPLIGEIVDLRNAVAHGRLTAEEVGGRFSRTDIETKIKNCRRLCMHVINQLETHCANHANLIR